MLLFIPVAACAVLAETNGFVTAQEVTMVVPSAKKLQEKENERERVAPAPAPSSSSPLIRTLVTHGLQLFREMRKRGESGVHARGRNWILTST